MATKTIATNFLVAQASALVIDAAMATEKIVRGLTGLALPIGFEMQNVVVSEMGRRIDLLVPSGGAYQSIDINANFVPGDPTQRIFQDAALNSTKLTTLRFYLKQGCDFAALDLINDSGGGYLIGTYSAPSVASKNELFQNSISILPAGSSILFIAHTPAGGGASLTFTAESDPTGASVTHATLDFETDFGFEAGDVVIIDKLLAYPLYAEVLSVSGSTMNFVFGSGQADEITPGAATADCQIHGATPIEVSGYSTTCD